VRILAGHRADPLAQRLAGLRVAHPGRAHRQVGAVHHVPAAEPVDQVRLGRRADHGHRDAAAGQHQLHRVPAEAARGAPDQNHVALLHHRAARAHQHPVRGGRAQRRAGRLLPGQVLGLGQQLAGLDDREVGQAAEVGLEPPGPLVAGHGVLVGHRVLAVHVRGRDHHPVAGRPAAHGGAGPHHHAGRVRADHVVRLVVPRAPPVLAAEPAQEGERRHRLEGRRPHRVEVDARGQHGDQRLVRRQLRHRHLADVQRPAHVAVVDPGEDVHVRPPQVGGAHGGRHRAGEQFRRRRTGQDGFGELRHA
jgi:hypothetical protein